MMKNKPLVLIFLYLRQNRYSINSLLGALQTKLHLLEKISLCLSFTEEQLLKDIKDLSRNHKKLVVGISFTSNQVSQVQKIIKNIKSLEIDNIILIAGGPHSTGDAISALRIGFDICFLGESEETFLEFLEREINNISWYNLSSIAFVNEYRQPVINKRQRSYLDLDKYPPITTYFNRYGPIEITRGCPYSCSFCQTSQIFGTKPRHRSIEKICEAVEEMAKRQLYDTRFITPSLFLYGAENGKKLNLEAVEELLKNVKKIIKSKGKLFIGTFPSEVRPEHINKDTVYLLKKYANNDNVIIGAQSGSDRILELCNRGHTVKDVLNAIKLLYEAGFKVNVDFIFGLPYEEEKDINQTIKFIDEITNRYKTKIHAHIFMPLVGTKFFNHKPSNLNFWREYCFQLKNKGILYGNWEKQLNYVSC